MRLYRLEALILSTHRLHLASQIEVEGEIDSLALALTSQASNSHLRNERLNSILYDDEEETRTINEYNDNGC